MNYYLHFSCITGLDLLTECFVYPTSFVDCIVGLDLLPKRFYPIAFVNCIARLDLLPERLFTQLCLYIVLLDWIYYQNVFTITICRLCRWFDIFPNCFVYQQCICFSIAGLDILLNYY